MKRILLIIFTIINAVTFAQTTDASLTSQANVIRNETSPNGNTTVRVANMFQGIINSKVSHIGNSFVADDTLSWILVSRNSDGAIFKRNVSTISGGGSSTYAGNSPTTVTVGGLASGNAISGMSYDDILQAILAPYVNPIFNSFSVSNAQTVEVGTTLSGSKTFSWGINVNSGTISGVDLYDITAASTLLAGTSNDGTEAQTITTIQLNSNGATQSWRAIGNDTGGGPATFNSNSYTVTGRYFRFFGPVASSPTNSATVRAISSGTYHSGTTTFSLNTGTTETRFVVALPPSVTISSVIDVTALNAVITSSYVLTGTINVLDAGGTNRSYNIYEMTIGAPYGVSHNHSITTAN